MPAKSSASKVGCLETSFTPTGAAKFTEATDSIDFKEGIKVSVIIVYSQVTFTFATALRLVIPKIKQRTMGYSTSWRAEPIEGFE